MPSNDPYGLFHLSLNKLPDEDIQTPPHTEWLNMGYWKGTSIFPEACKALASELYQAGKIPENGRVLDVGFGTGESLIFLLSDNTVPRLSSLTGITSLPVHHKRAQERVTRLLNSRLDSPTTITLLAGDAVWRSDVSTHPLHPLSDDVYDAIFALDCAYHFNTRKAFLSQSFKKLSPGGRIALADICFAPGSSQNWMTWSIIHLFGVMHKSNVVSTEDYTCEMQSVGYSDVNLVDITSEVFPGFLAFLKGRGFGWWIFAVMMESWLTWTSARFVIISGYKLFAV